MYSSAIRIDLEIPGHPVDGAKDSSFWIKARKPHVKYEKKNSEDDWVRRISSQMEYREMFWKTKHQLLIIFFPSCFGTLSETNRKCAEPCGGLCAPLLLQMGRRFPVWCHATLYIKACGDSLLSLLACTRYYLIFIYTFSPIFGPCLLFLDLRFCFHQKCTGYLLLFKLL